MGCNNSQFQDANESGDNDPLNEEKTEYSDLPSVTMILGEKIDRYFYCDKVLGIKYYANIFCYNKYIDISILALWYTL